MVGASHAGLTLDLTDLGGGVYTAFLRTRDFGTVISWSGRVLAHRRGGSGCGVIVVGCAIARSRPPCRPPCPPVAWTAVLIVAVIAAALWFDIFPWLSLHVPVDGSAINDLPAGVPEQTPAQAETAARPEAGRRV